MHWKTENIILMTIRLTNESNFIIKQLKKEKNVKEEGREENAKMK